MKTFTFIIFQISTRKASKSTYTAHDDQPIRFTRQAAKKLAGIETAPYSMIKDAYGNAILYTRKRDTLIHIVETPLYLAGDFERDPCGLILDQARRNAAAARKTRERSRKRQQARRTDRPLEIEGTVITSANVAGMLDTVKAMIKDAKRRGEAAGREYDKLMDGIDAELDTLEKQKAALNDFKKTFGKAQTAPRIYTAQNAEQEAAQAATPTLTTAALAEQSAIYDYDFI